MRVRWADRGSAEEEEQRKKETEPEKKPVRGEGGQGAQEKEK